VMFFGPRVALVFVWLLTDWYAAFDSTLVALAGWLLLPWTSFAWMYTYFHNAGELDGGYVVLIVLGALLDLGALGGGARSRGRERA